MANTRQFMVAGVVYDEAYHGSTAYRSKHDPTSYDLPYMSTIALRSGIHRFKSTCMW